jgi:hypothetical protein
MQSSPGKQRRSAGTAHAGVKASGPDMQQQVRVRRRNEIKRHTKLVGVLSSGIEVGYVCK